MNLITPPLLLPPPLTHFHPFLSLPLELIHLIITLTPPFDAVALSLASKSMYTITRASLLRLNPKAYSLRLPTCDRHIYGMQHCKVSDIHSRCASRTCDSSPSTVHCGVCRQLPLHRRLLSWVPKTLKWCGGEWGCCKFRPRKRLHKGRCLHGRKRPAAAKPALTFTFSKTKRGGWARTTQIWSKQHKDGALSACVYSRGRVRPTEEKTGYKLRDKPREAEKVRDHWREYDCGL